MFIATELTDSVGARRSEISSPINGLRNFIKRSYYKHPVPTARKPARSLLETVAPLLIRPRDGCQFARCADGRMLMTTDFETGVLLLSATLRTGTNTFVSGKYVAAQRRGML